MPRSGGAPFPFTLYSPSNADRPARSPARLPWGRLVPWLGEELSPRLQHLSFSFFDAHGSHSIFNRVTGDAQNTRLFVDGVILQGITTALTLGAYAVFMGRIHAGLTVA